MTRIDDPVSCERLEKMAKRLRCHPQILAQSMIDDSLTVLEDTSPLADLIPEVVKVSRHLLLVRRWFPRW